MLLPVDLIVYAILLAAAAALGWQCQRLRRQMLRYRRIAERQGRIAESLITELAGAQSDLEWLNARHDTARRLSGESIWEWHTGRNQLEFSESWKAALGYDDADLPPVLGTFELLLHPADRQPTLTTLHQFAQSGLTALCLGYRLRHHEGHFVQFECRAVRIPEHGGKSAVVLGLQRAAGSQEWPTIETPQCSDISAEHFRNAPVALLEWGSNGEISRYNQHAQTLFAWTREEIPHIRIFDLFPKSVRETFQRECEHLLEGKTAYVTTTSKMRTQAGDPLSVHWITTRQPPRPGEADALLSIGFEVTALTSAEAEGDAMARTEARGGLDQVLLREFHGPLAVILEEARMALHGQRSHFHAVRAAAENLQSLLDKLTAISRGDGSGEPDASPGFVLDEHLIEVCEPIRQRCRQQHIELRLQLADGVPQDLAGHAEPLEQVLATLLDHSLRQAEPGATLTVAVGVSARRGLRIQLRFMVTAASAGSLPDDGSGVAEELDPASGFHGLAAVNQLVKLMGGRIVLDRAAGSGHRLTFTAWFACAANRPRYLSAIPAAAREGRVLVLERDGESAEHLAALLTRLGLRAEATSDPQQALARILEAGCDPYAVVFLEWNPDTGGDGLPRFIQRLYRPEGRPRIVLTSSATLAEIERALGDLPLDGVLIRPLTGLHLANLIGGFHAEPPQGAVGRLLQGMRRPELPGLRVLLVDPLATSQLIATALLEDMGAQVCVANTGAEACAILAAAEGQPFDAILMDVDLPAADGYETCRRLRDGGRCGGLPIIAMTASPRQQEPRRHLLAGMNDCVQKPLSPRHLYTVLAHWCQPSLAATPAVGDSSANQAPAPAVHAHYPQLRGINAAEGLHYMSNKPALYEQVLKDFQRRFKHAPAQLRNALARADYANARHQAQMVKSLASSIGASELRSAAIDLESALAGTDRPESGIVEAFEESLAEVLAGLEEQFPIP